MFKTDELCQIPGNEIVELTGDGDFRSEECVELLNEADIVVTNPPFSLFREYVNLLVEKDKKFLILGSLNAITYKDIFPLFMNNRMCIWASIHSGNIAFYIPDDYPLTGANCGIDSDGRKNVRFSSIRWFTNIDIKQRHEEVILYKRYSPEEYPMYDNYDAINVDKTKDIPCDYPGVMGIPITFMDKYNPDQFEIVGMAAGNTRAMKFYFNVKYTPHKEDRGGCGVITGKRVYARILVQNKKPIL